MDTQWIVEALKKPKTKTALAAAMGVSPSAVTGIINGTRHIKAHELPAIMSYLGVAPPLEFLARAEPHENMPAGDRPPASSAGVHEEGSPYSVSPSPDDPRRGVIQTLLSGRPNASAWAMKSDILALQGVRKGDILIIDQSVEARTGDIVCAQIRDGHEVKTVFRLYQMPNLVPASFEPSATRVVAVNGETVRISGVMTFLIRHRSIM